MNLGISGKRALITGGSHGIGLAIALELASEGCNICICSRDEKKLVKAKNKIDLLGVECIALQCDVHHREDILSVVDDTIETFGSLDILVNNVGGGGRWGNEDIEKTNEAVWLEVYEKNVLSTIRFTLSFLPYMRKQKWGRVVTVTSIYGKESGGRPWFNVAKTAQTALMKNLSTTRKIIRDGVTFNSVAPGSIMIAGTGWEDEMLKDDHFEDRLDQEFNLGRLGTAAEISGVVAFLCSERAGFINGSSISADGGQSRCF